MRLLSRTARASIVAFTLVAAALPTGRASAHTELDYTLPAESTTVSETLTEITVGFTAAVTLTTTGFSVTDATGAQHTPFAVTDDDTVFRLQLDTPLPNGPVTVSYSVVSSDGHPIDGSFEFTMAAPTISATTPTTLPPPVSTLPGIPIGPGDSIAVDVSSSSSSAPPSASGTEPASGASLSATPTAASSGKSGSDQNTIILVAIVVAVAAGAFLLVRSRRQS